MVLVSGPVVGAEHDDPGMSHVLGLARLLLDYDDDDAFLDATGRAWAVLADLAPIEAIALLDLVSCRLDDVLEHDVSRETGVTTGTDVSRETNVSRETEVTSDA